MTTTFMPEVDVGTEMEPTTLALVSTSMRDGSLSRLLLDELGVAVVEQGAEVDLIDTRDLPVCNAGCEPYPPEIVALQARLAKAHGVVFAGPVHGYSVAGATKNLADLVGDAMAGKPFAIVTASGTERSHLAVVPLGSSLALENNAFWFAQSVQVTEDTLGTEETAERIEELAAGFLDFVRRLTSVRYG